MSRLSEYDATMYYLQKASDALPYSKNRQCVECQHFNGEDCNLQFSSIEENILFTNDRDEAAEICPCYEPEMLPEKCPITGQSFPRMEINRWEFFAFDPYSGDMFPVFDASAVAIAEARNEQAIADEQKYLEQVANGYWDEECDEEIDYNAQDFAYQAAKERAMNTRHYRD